MFVILEPTVWGKGCLPEEFDSFFHRVDLSKTNRESGPTGPDARLSPLTVRGDRRPTDVLTPPRRLCSFSCRKGLSSFGVVPGRWRQRRRLVRSVRRPWTGSKKKKKTLFLYTHNLLLPFRRHTTFPTSSSLLLVFRYNDPVFSRLLTNTFPS